MSDAQQTLALFADQPPVRRAPRDHDVAHARKRGVAQVIYEIMTERTTTARVWWTLPELERALLGRGRKVLATSISARLRDLRRQPFSAQVQRRHRAGSSYLEEYRIGIDGGEVAHG